MWVNRISISNYRGIKGAELDFNGHTLLVGANNVGKSTICEALDLALGTDRHRRYPVVEEYDFYNAQYLDDDGEPIEIRIEVRLIDVSPSVERACVNYLERWDPAENRILTKGEIEKVDGEGLKWCLRLLTIARYNKDEDEFEAATHYAKTYDPDNEDDSRVRRPIKRKIGFLYLRALRTGSRALTLERGSLLDVILRIQGLYAGTWEQVRHRLESLDPPIEEGTTNLPPVLKAIEKRLAEYISIANPGDATRLFVSQLTREHLRKTLSFFVSVAADQKPVPFQDLGTGTLNILVLALLSFVAELKEESILFAMEEPEIALPPHTQRRITSYLTTKTSQCFVSSHSPYVIERFKPEQVVILRRDDKASVTGNLVKLGDDVKAKTYRRYIRRGFAEAMLGRGVVVAEGITEKYAIEAVAEKMEADNDDNYPLDLAGVTIITTDGDGSIAEFGRLFGSLDLPTFAFYDKKDRPKKEQEALGSAGFEILNEIEYAGMEALLAAEVPLDHQWSYLEQIRDSGVAPNVGLPADRPDDDGVREYTRQVLKGGKGWGRAADLIERCNADELPQTIVSFLDQIYTRFPRPATTDIGEMTGDGQETPKDDPTDQEAGDVGTGEGA